MYNEKKFIWSVGKITENIGNLLLKKNKKYGNAALEPIKLFNKEEAANSIAIRIDDKINRIKNESEPSKNDVVDLIGYLILYMISKEWTVF